MGRLIGVLTAELRDSYQTAVWHGILEESEGHDETLICFIGSRINSPDAQEVAASTVYDLATIENLDGLIVVSSVLSRYVGKDSVQKLFDDLGPIPKVSIGIPVEGAGSVKSDTGKALESLVDHLVIEHRRRRFAFIAGPRWHVESEDRRQVVERRLRYHGIRLDGDRLFHGTFETESGADAVAAMFSRGEPPDAIMVCNDHMAIGALRELTALGISVPGQVSLTGIDGIDKTQFSKPPITTVVQPLEEIGRASLRELRRAMDKEPCRDLFFGSQLLFRESCGCPPGRGSDHQEDEDLGEEVDSSSSWERERIQGAKRLEEREHRRLIREVVLSLSETFTFNVLMNRLKEGLDQLGYRDAFVVLRDGADNSTSILSKRIQDGRDIGEGGVTFPSGRILPQGLLDIHGRKSWLLTPLVFLDRSLGYLILPGDTPDDEACEILAIHLATSIQGALLIDQIKVHEQSLEREILERTQEITETNRMLRLEIEKRTRLESEVAEISRRTMERIGQDLHDDLCQYLAGISMHMSVLENQLGDENREFRDEVSQLKGLIGSSIEKTKAIARGLIPVDLGERGLYSALEILADSTSISTGIPITLSGVRDWPLPSIQRMLEIYRIIQEALNNATRHSGCSSIEIKLSTIPAPDGGALLVAEVKDDGTGILPSPTCGGMGLKIMRYRAEKSGAKLEIDTGSGGTTIRCILTENPEILLCTPFSS